MPVVRKVVVALSFTVVLAACGGSEPGQDPGNSSGGTSSSGGSPSSTGATTSTGGRSSTAGNSAGGGAGAPVSIGDLLPWKEGNVWTYQVTDEDGAVTIKRTTVGPLEVVGGTGPNKDRMANKVVTHKDDTGDGAELDETVSWQGIEGERIVRYREQSFGRTTKELELEEHWDPSKLHIDSSPQNTTVGYNWLESYKESKLPVGETPINNSPTSDRWFVERREMVTVPAGTFDALVLRKVSGSGNAKTYWYSPGVGKIKETGGQTEELTEYQLN